MSPTRSLLLTASGAALVVGAAWWFLHDRADHVTESPLLCPELAGTAPAQVAVMMPDGKAWRATRENGQWRLAQLAGVPAPEALVAQFIHQLSAATRDEEKTALAENHAKLGLLAPDAKDAPADGKGVRVTLSDATGKVLADVVLGHGNAGGRFVRRTGQAQTWLSRGAPLPPPSALAAADRAFGGLTDARFKSATLTPPLAKPLHLDTPPETPAAKPDGKTPPPPAYPWKADAVRRILGCIGYPQLEDAMKDIPSGAPTLLRFEPADPANAGVEARLWPVGTDRAWVELRAIPPQTPTSDAKPDAKPGDKPAEPPPGIAEAKQLNERWQGRVYLAGGDLGFAARQTAQTLENPAGKTPGPGAK